MENCTNSLSKLPTTTFASHSKAINFFFFFFTGRSSERIGPDSSSRFISGDQRGHAVSTAHFLYLRSRVVREHDSLSNDPSAFNRKALPNRLIASRVFDNLWITTAIARVLPLNSTFAGQFFGNSSTLDERSILLETGTITGTQLLQSE